jgi:hypothetical protein
VHSVAASPPNATQQGYTNELLAAVHTTYGYARESFQCSKARSGTRAQSYASVGRGGVGAHETAWVGGAEGMTRRVTDMSKGWEMRWGGMRGYMPRSA